MIEKFTASNGIEIDFDRDGHLGIEHNGMRPPFTVSTTAKKALREFFQHERDQELGRWRDPELPWFLVYLDKQVSEGPRIVRVMSEKSGHRTVVAEGEPQDMDVRVVANRYFAAHPKPKPWDQAKNKEVWALRFRDQVGFLPYSVMADEGGARFFWTGAEEFVPGYFASEFADGRRIWPEK